MEYTKVYCKKCKWDDKYGTCRVYNEYSDTYDDYTRSIQNKYGNCPYYIPAKEEVDEKMHS